MCLARCLKCLSGGSSESVDCASVVADGVAELADSPANTKTMPQFGTRCVVVAHCSARAAKRF